MKRFFQKLVDYFAIPKAEQRSNRIESNSIRPMLNKVLVSSLIVTLLLFVALFFFFGNNKTFALFTVASVIGAYYISGCALGFIFAIPKSFQNNQTAQVVSKDGKTDGRSATGYKDNTSIEEISDWITKIIIGLTLTQFGEIKIMLADASAHIAKSLQSAVPQVQGGAQIDLYTFSYALIILYAIAGTMSGYLWTRIEFPKILTQKENDIETLKYKELSEGLIRSMNDPGNTTIDTASLLKKSSELVQEDLVQVMQKIIDATPNGPDPDDPQKGRWGGIAVLNNTRLSAEVTSASIPGLYKVKLIASTIDGTPLLTPVGIVLHDSFEPMLRVLDPKGDKDVFLEVVAYEAFTVGALCNVTSAKEYARLELDLNQLPNLPKGFYWS
jgi:hypothetical protein